jgi:hypothetical protein
VAMHFGVRGEHGSSSFEPDADHAGLGGAGMSPAPTGAAKS